MILNENEVQVCLKYGIESFFKKDGILQIRDMHLKITDKAEMKAIVVYQGHTLDLEGEFTLSYQNGRIGFENIKGKIEYLFLQFSIPSILKQMIRDKHFVCQEDACYYICDLPIKSMSIENEHVCVEFKERL